MSTRPALFHVILYVLISKDHRCLWSVLSRVSWRNSNLLSDLMDGSGSYVFHHQSPGRAVQSPDGLSCVASCVHCIVALLLISCHLIVIYRINLHEHQCTNWFDESVQGIGLRQCFNYSDYELLLPGSKPVYTDEFNKWAAACQTIELNYLFCKYNLW